MRTSIGKPPGPRVALVTGGVGSIGRAVVEAFLASGYAVAFTDLRLEPGDVLESDLRSQGAQALFIRSDARKEADAAAAVASVLAHFGRLDVSVNTVGGLTGNDPAGVPLGEVTLSGWNETMALNLTSAFLSMKHALGVMEAQGAGTIINIASLAGLRVTPHAPFAYHAAKAAVIHLTEAAAVAYAARGVRINAVAPGLTDIGGLDTIAGQRRAQMARDFHPSGAMVLPARIADACVWLASERAAGITGVTVPIDGGWAAK